MTRFVVVPQWQGSASSRAMRLIDGAQIIAGDLPRAATTAAEVRLEAGDELGTGVRRWSALLRSAAAQIEISSASPTERTVAIGGDAGVGTTAALAALGTTDGGVDADAVIVWFAAHPGLHDPASSPTRAYESMAARALIDADAPSPASGAVLRPGRLVLAAARAADDHESDVAARMGVPLHRDVDIDRLVADVSALAPSALFVHIALDALDPAAITGVTAPEPFGAQVAELTAAVRALAGVAPIAGGALTGFAPASEDEALEDLGAILRIVGALA